MAERKRPRKAPKPPRSAAPGVAEAAPFTAGPVRCRHFGPCGGCTLLDLPYAEELVLKQEALARLAALSPGLAAAELRPVRAAREPLFYRTALKVPFGRGPRGPVAGFFRRRSHHIVDLEECAIQQPRLTELLRETRSLAARRGIAIYDEARHEGVLRHLVARVGAGTGQMLAGLVVREGARPEVKELADELLARMASRGLVGVVENVQSERGNAVLGPTTRPLAGTDLLEEEVDGLRLKTALDAFAQVNAAQASVLYGEVVALLGGAGGGAPLLGQRIADLYAGYGPIALRLARAGAAVVAIERSAVAAAAGEAIARDNGLTERVRFVAGDAEHGLRRAVVDGLDALVVDPPRRGLGEGLVRLLADLALPRIVYVSCNPETLARDVDALAGAFTARVVQPVDLFPRTDHLETVTLLVRT